MWSGFKRGSRENDTVTQSGSRGFNLDFSPQMGINVQITDKSSGVTGVSHIDCQYFGRNNILQIGTNWGEARARRAAGERRGVH